MNIITGDSKTGKSSLIEIVDYCLFSNRCTIPKGIITNYADYYAIILKVNDLYLVIARPDAKSINREKAFFNIETNPNFIKSFSFSYFKDLPLRKIKNDVQIEVERFLGLSVSDTRNDYDEDKRKFGKATLRSFVSFIFQHQNLLANKHSLFYRFDDFYKRKKTIEQVPILLGWVGADYYRLIKELEDKTNLLKSQEKIQKKIIKINEELLNKLYPLVNAYYIMIGKELESGLSFYELKKIGLNLPLIQSSAYSDTDLQTAIKKLKENRSKKQNELYEINELLKSLEENEIYSNTYSMQLSVLKESANSGESFENLYCPICQNRVKELELAIKEIEDSKIELNKELLKVQTYRVDTSEQISDLITKRDSVKFEIRNITAEIELLKYKNKAITEEESLRDKAMVLKGTIETTIKQILKQNSFTKSDIDLDDLKFQISILKEKIDGFDIEKKYEAANVFLNKRMNEICNNLDFEEDLRPGEFQFDLKTFEFYYHYNNKEKIYLSEMGSGANWLASHLSLFIALLNLSCKESKSCIPSLLFLDQPSQVYFPKSYGSEPENLNDINSIEKKIEENIYQVKNIFKVIGEEAIRIEEDCGFLPQIIVMDHADEIEFDKYVKKRWRKDGEKLI